jgi:hypothetical protein
MPSLTNELTTIGLQVLVIVAGAGLIAAVLRRRRPGRSALPSVAGVVAAAWLVLIAAGQISDSVSEMNRERRGGVTAERGRDECAHEPGGVRAANLSGTRLPFAIWARHQMGVGATYSLAGFRPPPDITCLYLVLLPALPATPGQRAGWTIAFGSLSEAMRARVAAHDPAVRVYAAGFALERNPLK